MSILQIQELGSLMLLLSAVGFSYFLLKEPKKRPIVLAFVLLAIFIYSFAYMTQVLPSFSEFISAV